MVGSRGGADRSRARDAAADGAANPDGAVEERAEAALGTASGIAENRHGHARDDRVCGSRAHSPRPRYYANDHSRDVLDIVAVEMDIADAASARRRSMRRASRWLRTEARSPISPIAPRSRRDPSPGDHRADRATLIGRRSGAGQQSGHSAFQRALATVGHPRQFTTCALRARRRERCDRRGVRPSRAAPEGRPVATFAHLQRLARDLGTAAGCAARAYATPAAFARRI